MTTRHTAAEQWFLLGLLLPLAGFAATGTPRPRNQTVSLAGYQLVRYISSAGVAVLDGENQHRIAVGADQARLDGFTIRRGLVRGRGGAILCDHEASPRIVANLCVQNLTGVNDPMRSSDGGGLSIYDHSHPLVSRNIIAANRTLNGNDAGGIFVAPWSAPRIEDNFIGGQKHHYGTELDPVPPAAAYLVRLCGNTIIGNENPSHNSGARITMQARAELRNNGIARNEAGLYIQIAAALVSRDSDGASPASKSPDFQRTHRSPAAPPVSETSSRASSATGAFASRSLSLTAFAPAIPASAPARMEATLECRNEP